MKNPERFVEYAPKLQTLYSSLANRTERYLLAQHLIATLYLEGDISVTGREVLRSILKDSGHNISDTEIATDGLAMVQKHIDLRELNKFNTTGMRKEATAWWVGTLKDAGELPVAAYKIFIEELPLAIADQEQTQRLHGVTG